MTIRRQNQVVYLEEDCRVEEAEALAAILADPGPWIVDVSLCRHLHTAVVQALLRFKPAVRGTPEAPFLRHLLAPALGAVIGNSEPTSP